MNTPPEKIIGRLVNVTVILVAAASWLSHTFSNYSTLIFAVAGGLSISASYLAFKIGARGRQVDASTIENAHSGSSSVTDAALSKLEVEQPHNTPTKPDFLMGAAGEEDTYWTLVKSISNQYSAACEPIIRHRKRTESTLNVVNIYLTDIGVKSTEDRDFEADYNLSKQRVLH